MSVTHSCNDCSSAPLTQYENNDIYRELIEEDDYFGDERNERVYIDMRRSKGYTDELEKINHDDSGIALNIKLKKDAAKNYDLELQVSLKTNIGIYYPIKDILCLIKTIIFRKQTLIKIKKKELDEYFSKCRSGKKIISVKRKV